MAKAKAIIENIDNPERDYVVKVSVKNGRIIDLMRREGFETQSALAKAAMVEPTVVSELLAMKRSPISPQKNDYRDHVYRIAAALNCAPDELFTERQKTMQLKTNSTEVSISEPEIVAITSGGQDIESAAWAKAQVTKLLAGLPERQAYVLRQRAEGATLDELADDLSVTRERVRQIEAKAIRMLKHPARWDENDTGFKQGVWA